MTSAVLIDAENADVVVLAAYASSLNDENKRWQKLLYPSM